MPMQTVSQVACILLAIAAALPTDNAGPKPSAIACPPRGVTMDAEVVRVIDGDTIVLRTSVEYHVRLIDCWAPESRTTDKSEKAKGLKAKARMQQLAATGSAVRVHVPTGEDLSDVMTLGRVLGRVWLMDGESPASSDLSAVMVREGLATEQKQ